MSAVQYESPFLEVTVGILDSGKPGFPADCILSGGERTMLPQSRDNALLLIPQFRVGAGPVLFGRLIVCTSLCRSVFLCACLCVLGRGECCGGGVID